MSESNGMREKIENIERILIGNGTKGLIRKMEEAMTAIIQLKANNSVKMWIYRSSIGILIAITSFLLTRAYYLKFG